MCPAVSISAVSISWLCLAVSIRSLCWPWHSPSRYSDLGAACRNAQTLVLELLARVQARSDWASPRLRGAALGREMPPLQPDPSGPGARAFLSPNLLVAAWKGLAHLAPTRTAQSGPCRSFAVAKRALGGVRSSPNPPPLLSAAAQRCVKVDRPRESSAPSGFVSVSGTCLHHPQCFSQISARLMGVRCAARRHLARAQPRLPTRDCVRESDVLTARRCGATPARRALPGMPAQSKTLVPSMTPPATIDRTPMLSPPVTSTHTRSGSPAHRSTRADRATRGRAPRTWTMALYALRTCRDPSSACAMAWRNTLWYRISP